MISNVVGSILKIKLVNDGIVSLVWLTIYCRSAQSGSLG